jgi:hypothetical protein
MTSTLSWSYQLRARLAAISGLFLVVGRHHLDRFAQHLAAHFLDRQSGRDDRPVAGKVGIHAGQIRQHADLDDVVADLALRRRRNRSYANDCQRCHQLLDCKLVTHHVLH